MDSILGVIPARGGSKGLPHKNILPLWGKPLIAWTIEAALASDVFRRIIVTTDDEETATVARQWGADVPFMRPPELASDDARQIDVVQHATNWIIHNDFLPDRIFLLQPTSPLRTADHVRGTVTLGYERNADAIIGVSEAASHPYLTRRITEDGTLSDFIDTAGLSLRRQDLPPAYVINGAAYLVRTSVILEEQTFFPARRTYPYIMPPEQSLDIDTSWDFYLVGLILKDRGMTE